MPYKIPSDTLNSVKSLIAQGLSTSDIVQRTGVSKWTINRLKNQSNPSYKRPHGGRSSPISNTTKVVLRYKVRCGSLRSSRDVRQWLLGLGYFIGDRQVRNLMRQLNLFSSIKKKRPFYKRNHPKDRLKWAKEHRDWTVDDWKKVIFSDETKVNMWESDGATYTWKEKNQPDRPHNVKQTMKHGGGSLMVWGCMTSLGPGYACQIYDGTMNSEDYIHILSTTYKDTLDYYGLTHDDVLFQQDGDPKHTSITSRKWFKRMGIKYIQDWPAQSPDLNPIEHLWHHVKSRLGAYSTKPKNIEELWRRFDVEWNTFTMEDMQPYYNSMPARIKAVIKAKGGYTRY